MSTPALTELSVQQFLTKNDLTPGPLHPPSGASLYAMRMTIAFQMGSQETGLIQLFSFRVKAEIWGGTKKPWDLFVKNCVFILVCLNFSYLQRTLHLMQYIYWDIFVHCSKHFLNLSILMSFSTPAVFCFTSSTVAKHFLLRNFFILRNKKKKTLKVRLGEWGVRCGGHAIFWSKTAEHSVWCR